MKNTFYFTLKALFVLKIINFCLCFVEDKANFKIYDVKTWETNICNKHIPNISRNKCEVIAIRQ